MPSLDKQILRPILEMVAVVTRTRRARRGGVGLLVFLLLFGLVGYFGAPPLIRHVAQERLNHLLGRPVSIAHVGFNPYTLRLEADDIHIGDRDGQGAFIDVGALVVRPSWTSLFRLAPIIGEISLVAPRVHIVRYDAQRFNFTDLVEAFAQPSPTPASQGSPARFALSNIRILDGRIEFEDELLSTRHVVDQISLALPFIATLPSKADLFVEPKLSARVDDSRFTLDARTKPFSDSLDSSVDLKIDQLDVPALLSYSPAPLPIVVKQGRLSSDLVLTFAVGENQPVLTVSGSIGVDDVKIDDSADKPLFAVHALHAVLSHVEPLRGIAHFDDIRIDQPDVRVERDRDGRFNLQKAMGTDNGGASTTPGGNGASPLDLAIRHLTIEGGALHLSDASTDPPAPLSLGQIEATLTDFSLTDKAPTPYSLSFAMDGGGKFAASGAVTLAGAQASTKFDIDALRLPALQPFLAAVTPVRVADGTLDASLLVEADWSKAPMDLRVKDSRIALKSLRLALPDGKEPAIALSEAQVRLTKIDLADHAAEVAGVGVTGLAVNATRLANGDIDLIALAGPRSPPTGPSTAPAAPAWHYAVDEVTLKDAKLSFTDRTVSRPATLDLSLPQLAVRHLGDDLSRPVPITMTATLNRQGSIEISGEVAASPLKAGLKLNGNRIDLAAFAPYLAGGVNATVKSAFLNMEGDLALEQSRRTVRASYRGNAALVDVKVLDSQTSSPFAGWRSLAMSGLNAGYDEKRGTDIDAASVTFSHFYGDVLLDAQGRLSLQEVVPQGDGREQAGSVPLSPGARRGSSGTGSPPVRLRIGQVLLQSGRLTYTDNFIKPNYSADLVAINGKIGELSSDAATPAPVMIGALLSANGPISIQGGINPLATKPSLDLTAIAKDIELTNLTPYSTKYAGYPITKGKLNVDLHYQLENDQLSANNHMFIDQLTFGEHIDNDTATSLPVRFAIDLMKNSQGQIDVNIPVSGSLSNPEFSVGGIIWDAFVNLLEKAVTSPFTLLANAFGGGEDAAAGDLGYIEFAPGLADLSEASTKKLDTIATLLSDKSTITVDLAGRVDPDTDLPGLRQAFVEEQVKKRKMAELDDEGAHIDPARVTVEAGEYSTYLTEAYEAADFKKPRTMIGLLKTLPDEEMKKALADHAPVDGKSLPDLARRRAQTVRVYLAGKIDPGRIAVGEPKPDATGNDGKGAATRVDITLK